MREKAGALVSGVIIANNAPRPTKVVLVLAQARDGRRRAARNATHSPELLVSLVSWVRGRPGRRRIIAAIRGSRRQWVR